MNRQSSAFQYSQANNNFGGHPQNQVTSGYLPLTSEYEDHRSFPARGPNTHMARPHYTSGEGYNMPYMPPPVPGFQPYPDYYHPPYCVFPPHIQPAQFRGSYCQAQPRPLPHQAYHSDYEQTRYPDKFPDEESTPYDEELDQQGPAKTKPSGQHGRSQLTRRGSWQANGEVSPSPSEVDMPEEIPNWEGYPDGDFIRDFTWGEYHALKKFPTHWASRTSSDPGTGSQLSHMLKDGYHNTHFCQGIITCNGCSKLCRPGVEKVNTKKKAAKSCKCGGTLEHIQCNTKQIITKWASGVRYEHWNEHCHPKPFLIHLAPEEQRHWEAIIQAKPKATIAQLMVGIQMLTRKTEPASDISPIFVNPH
ncbi:hypothetical protein NP233_g11968 [Leucocoprinus birnbaumii]|uniref:GCM domain-containing protein n=1 Tax=Leucocoprinus birnbaumii TaxID=56174 RepID=A0AAD5VGH0_9AGAR|nr:hypothetical protein NP233_g11968 [Leucocoprinus birnbaumii]